MTLHRTESANCKASFSSDMSPSPEYGIAELVSDCEEEFSLIQSLNLSKEQKLTIDAEASHDLVI